MNTAIGNKLRKLRKQKGLTQKQVSEALCISQSTYARMENGESGSWAAHLIGICKFYEIQPEQLFKRESVIINNVGINNGVNGAGNIETVNVLSEKLIEQYEARLKEKDEIINLLKSRS